MKLMGFFREYYLKSNMRIFENVFVCKDMRVIGLSIVL